MSLLTGPPSIPAFGPLGMCGESAVPGNLPDLCRLGGRQLQREHGVDISESEGRTAVPAAVFPGITVGVCCVCHTR